MRSLLKPMAAGALGVVLALLAWHLWMDHQALHELDAYIRMVAPKINKLP